MIQLPEAIGGFVKGFALASHCPLDAQHRVQETAHQGDLGKQAFPRQLGAVPPVGVDDLRRIVSFERHCFLLEFSVSGAQAYLVRCFRHPYPQKALICRCGCHINPFSQPPGMLFIGNQVRGEKRLGLSPHCRQLRPDSRLEWRCTNTSGCDRAHGQSLYMARRSVSDTALSPLPPSSQSYRA